MTGRRSSAVLSAACPRLSQVGKALPAIRDNAAEVSEAGLAPWSELPFLDLTDAFRAARSQSLSGKIDRHWSHVGQRVAAEKVAQFLER